MEERDKKAKEGGSILNPLFQGAPTQEKGLGQSNYFKLQLRRPHRYLFSSFGTIMQVMINWDAEVFLFDKIVSHAHIQAKSILIMTLFGPVSEAS